MILYLTCILIWGGLYSFIKNINCQKYSQFKFDGINTYSYVYQAGQETDVDSKVHHSYEEVTVLLF